MNHKNEVLKSDMPTIGFNAAENKINDTAGIIDSTNPKKVEGVATTKSRISLIWSELRNMNVELIAFIYAFSLTLRLVTTTSLMIDKACYVHLELPQEVCTNLSAPEYDSLKSAVERIANNYQLGFILIQYLPSSMLACFVGSWSDTYGRKLPMIISMAGLLMEGFAIALCAIFMGSRLEYLLLAGVFTGASGGVISVFSILFSYTADITTPDKRTIKFAFLEVAVGLASPAGQLAGGWMFRYTGYTPVFLVSAAGQLVTLVLVVFALKETTGLDSVHSWAEKARSFCSLQPVIDSFKTTIKPRPNQGRKQILLLILALSCSVLSVAAGGRIEYLFVYHLFNWDNAKYSTIAAVFTVMTTVCTLVVVPIFKRLRFGDPILGIMGNMSMLAQNIAVSIAKPEFFYLGNLFGLLGGLSTLAGRSRISKLACKEDIGKIFAFLMTAETLVPVIATAVVSQIFNATMETMPGITYVGLAILLVIPLGIFTWVALLPDIDDEENCISDDRNNSSDISKLSKVSSSQ